MNRAAMEYPTNLTAQKLTYPRYGLATPAGMAHDRTNPGLGSNCNFCPALIVRTEDLNATFLHTAVSCVRLAHRKSRSPSGQERSTRTQSHRPIDSAVDPEQNTTGI